jgi:hypothetical protein
MDNDEFQRAWEEKRKSKPPKFGRKAMAEHNKNYQDSRKDFGDDRATSAWPEIYPQRDLPLHKVDFSKGLVQFNSRFIRGTACLDEVTSTYSDQKQPWLQGDGVYLFKNIEPILDQTNLLVEFFRGLYALRKGEIDKTLFTDGTLIKNNISMCIICNDEQFKKLIAAHNKLRADFQLATIVDMAI